ncbi:MAG: hypothetical protein LC808_05175 [Actinobacteria bacterium]|nr:hypothetical protein [Actinomycetota bacterium]
MRQWLNDDEASDLRGSDAVQPRAGARVVRVQRFGRVVRQQRNGALGVQHYVAGECKSTAHPVSVLAAARSTGDQGQPGADGSRAVVG